MLLRRAVPLLVVGLCACQEVQGPDAPGPIEELPAEIKIATRGPHFIVTLQDGVSPDAVSRAHGVNADFVYTGVMNGFAGSISDAARMGLMRDARVLRVERDQEVNSDSTLAAGSWGLDRIDQRPLPLNSTYTFDATGAGVSIYIVDSGIRYTHAEFGGRASFGYDALGGDGSDCNGHGTHVAGTAAGAKYGVAKSASLVSVRVLGCEATGSVSGIIAGLDWIAKNGRRPGVANVSIKASPSTALDDAVRRLYQAGIVTAVSAGNSGADACGQSPARAPEAMTTGATTTSDARASYSNYGSCVDWFAPGSGITSAAYGSDTGTRNMSGTSMASPHSAGAAALFLQRNPGATPLQVRNGVFEQTSKGKVTSANSANNHLLYSLGESDGTPIVVTNQPPTADFAATCVDLECSFTNGSVDADGMISRYSWQFADGTTSSEQHPKHQFAAQGLYSVKLTVTDNSGASATATRSVEALAPASIGLMAVRTKVRGVNFVVLTWTGAQTARVDVYRNSSKLGTVPVAGPYSDDLGKGSVSSSATYRVCEAGTTVCSHNVTPSY